MKKSAGILPFRKNGDEVEIFLVHPGGPFWKNKDQHSWSVAKGEFTDEEIPFEAALREFHEETGLSLSGHFTELKPNKQPGGKTVYAWAIETDLNPDDVKSNTFALEWPPRTGKIIEVPEIDKAAWIPLSEAYRKIHKGQMPILDQLSKLIGSEESL